MTIDQLTPAARTTLLLCATLPSDKTRTNKPLSTGEFHRLRSALAANGMTFSELFAPEDTEQWMELATQIAWDGQRCIALLERSAEFESVFAQWNELGLWVLNYEDERYPQRWRDRLRDAAPPVLYGVGSATLLSKEGLAVVGSRNADEAALDFTTRLGRLCAEQDIAVISGGARGIDQAAMSASLDANGFAIGLLADSLAKAAMLEQNLTHLERKRLLLMSACSPDASFNVGNAMSRNKFIYALADAAMVVSSDAESGGTWSGATENLKQKWTPLIVRRDESVPRGNELLIARGGMAFSSTQLNNAWDVRAWFSADTRSDNYSLFA